MREGRYPSTSAPGWSHISPQGQRTIQKLLTVSPLKRLSAFEALQEPWMKLRHRTEISRSSSLEEARTNMKRRQTHANGHTQTKVLAPSALAC